MATLLCRRFELQSWREPPGGGCLTGIHLIKTQQGPWCHLFRVNKEHCQILVFFDVLLAVTMTDQLEEATLYCVTMLASGKCFHLATIFRSAGEQIRGTLQKLVMTGQRAA